MSSAPFVHWVHFPMHYNDINKKLKKKIETKGDKVLVLSQGQLQSNKIEL